jgi:hypothetical protein
VYTRICSLKWELYYMEMKHQRAKHSDLGLTSKGRDQEIWCLRPAGQKVSETPSEQKSWAWWYAPVMPAIQEI